MILALATTLLILVWCLLLSLGWAELCYARVAFGRPYLRPEGHGGGSQLATAATLPGLVLAPLLLLVAFRATATNLLFPVSFLASYSEWCLAALAPASVLFLASGLASSLRRMVYDEYTHWRQQPFTRLAVAMGKSVPKTLRPLVLARSLSQAWGQCLPWLYGELVVVEAVFNAPGLGLEAWHLARVRDVGGLLAVAAVLVSIYAISQALCVRSARRLGQRLASYV